MNSTVRSARDRNRFVRKLRAEAGERGLDPNVWFHNVEYVAAERVGQETVTYVSNIYKYDIAYSLVMRDEGVRRKRRSRRSRATPSSRYDLNSAAERNRHGDERDSADQEAESDEP